MTTEAKPAALTLLSLSDALYVRNTWLAEGAGEPQPVWIDARELCDELGYEKHQHGGHTRKNIAVVVKALRDLTRFRVELALGSKVYPQDAATGGRTAGRVTKRNISKVLLVTDTDEVRFLIDGATSQRGGRSRQENGSRTFPASSRHCSIERYKTNQETKEATTNGCCRY